MNHIEFGDCREILKRWASEGVKAQMCVTSPPYFGLRDYGVDGQLGMEETPGEFVQNLVEVFRAVRGVLRDDGTLWLNLGDSYAGYHGNKQVPDGDAPSNKAGYTENMRASTVGMGSLKPKDLIGIPWRVAMALQSDGWYLRQDIIWHKPNPMPESVTDRCTKAHEYLFLLSKSARYYYDHEAIKDPATQAFIKNGRKCKSDPMWEDSKKGDNRGSLHNQGNGNLTRNRHSVWTIPTKPYAKAHFAVFPEKLIEPCILAGSPEGGIVLDPFMGSGTTAAVAFENGRQYLGCELNLEYKALQDERIESAFHKRDNKRSVLF